MSTSLKNKIYNKIIKPTMCYVIHGSEGIVEVTNGLVLVITTI